MIVQLNFKRSVRNKLIFYLSTKNTEVSIRMFPESPRPLLDSYAVTKIPARERYFWWINFEIPVSGRKRLSCRRIRKKLLGPLEYVANLDNSSWKEDTMHEAGVISFCDDVWPILATLPEKDIIEEYTIPFDTCTLPIGHWFGKVLENGFSQDVQEFLKLRKECYT